MSSEKSVIACSAPIHSSRMSTSTRRPGFKSPRSRRPSSIQSDLEPAEKHLYESAQVAAQSRARNEAGRLALAEEADRKATERVSREVVSATVDRILDLAKTADPRNPPR